MATAFSLQEATELVLEIHSGEGGEDSRLFAQDLLSAYLRYGESLKFESEILYQSQRRSVVRLKGTGLWEAFRHESGKHCVQRVPPTEKGGKRHTSIVSVVVLPLPPRKDAIPLPEEEVGFKTQTGQGPGGQHRNRSQTAVRAKHLPTGITAWVDGRSQHQNRVEALRILTAKVNEARVKEQNESYSNTRRNRMGTGNRGAKIRTYNFIEGIVTDHRTGKRTSKVKQIMKGDFGLILR